MSLNAKPKSYDITRVSGIQGLVIYSWSNKTSVLKTHVSSCKRTTFIIRTLASVEGTMSWYNGQLLKLEGMCPE